VALLGALATGHYDDAQLLPASRRDAAGLLVLALGLAVASAVATLIVAPWRESVASLFNSPDLAPVLHLLPPGLLLLAWGQALEGWHTRHKRFGLVSGGRVAQSIVVVAVQIAAGLLGAGAFGLAGGAALGFAALAFTVGAPLLVRDRAVLRASARWLTLRTLAVRYRRFPLFSTPAAFLNLLSSRVPILLLASFFGATTVGFFGLAFGTLALPVGVVTGAVGQVFGVRAPVAFREGTLGRLTEQVYRRLLAAALFPMAAVALAGPDLFAFVFGEPWREAGVYAQYLAPWIFIASVASPLTRIFDVTEKQRTDLGFSILLFSAQILALVLAYRTGQPRIAVASVAVAGVISRTLQVFWMLRIGGASVKRAGYDLAQHTAVAAALLIPAGLVIWLSESILLLIGALVASGCAYGALVIRMDWRNVHKKDSEPKESTGT
jgi:O-antigen/teichoic acid export membrane protein